MVKNTDSLPEVERLSGVLRAWPDGCTWEELQEAAAIGPLLRRHLELNEVWDLVLAVERASVLWAMAAGVRHSPSTRPPQDQYLSHTIRELLETAEYFGRMFLIGDAYYFPGERSREAEQGEEFARRLANLPEGWRGEVVRRIRGGQEFGAAISDAAISLNMLHHVHRIDGAKEAAGNVLP